MYLVIITYLDYYLLISYVMDQDCVLAARAMFVFDRLHFFPLSICHRCSRSIRPSANLFLVEFIFCYRCSRQTCLECHPLDLLENLMALAYPRHYHFKAWLYPKAFWSSTTHSLALHDLNSIASTLCCRCCCRDSFSTSQVLSSASWILYIFERICHQYQIFHLWNRVVWFFSKLLLYWQACHPFYWTTSVSHPV